MLGPARKVWARCLVGKAASAAAVVWRQELRGRLVRQRYLSPGPFPRVVLLQELSCCRP